MNKKTIVYTISNDYFFFHFKPIYDVLKKDERLKILFMYPSGEFGVKNFLSKNVGDSFVVSNSRGDIAPDMFISAEMHPTMHIPNFFNEVKKVQIYHGIGIYNFEENLKNLLKYNVHFLVGPHWDSFSKKIKYYREKAKIYNIGLPKTDDLFRVPMKKLSKKKVIVYSAHWNSFSSINKFGCNIIDAICSAKNAEVFVRPHNHIFKEKGDSFRKKLSSIEARHKNLKIVYEPDNCEIYKKADLVITDVGSTAALEASALGIPVIIFDNKQWFNNKSNTYIEKNMLETCLKFETIESLLQILKKNIRLTQNKKQRLMAQNALYNCGKSTKIAAQTIIKELGLEP